ncbi:transketolase family protein [Streptomyces sp. NBC_01262]|uniref:transketolase family protein n=1 Tax=Streptomyces sp. NBC_01262 TaxID=2903803 RepID=UPI002E35DEFF|nr:transketolase C-terminal domain-containing protein [Streptomyces sp. NBC_01262]
MSSLDAWYEEYGLNSRETARVAQLELAREDPRIYSLENDLAMPTVPFHEEFPGRHIQAGIAESNLMGMAAGLAMRGKIPYVNTFATFAVARACEQLRLDLAYNRAGVKVVGYYAGLSGGMAGPTHHSTEDIAITRAIPDLTVLSPADSYEAYRAVKAAARHDGPVYIRAGRAATPRVHREDYEFTIGKAVRLRQGGEVTVFATGCLMVAEAQRAAELLAADGVECTVYDVHTLKPFDEEAVIEAAESSRLLVTLEDHSVLGGLGSAVAGTALEHRPRPVLRFGVPDTFCTTVAEYEDLPGLYGFGAEDVRQGVTKWLRQNPSPSR